MTYSVLIVDDEPLVRAGLQLLISSRQQEWEVRGLFADGRGALAAATENRFDVILADIRMPHLDGIQLAQRLRTVSPETVVVVMSGYKEFDYARRAMKSGVVDFIVKPIEEEELFAALERARQELEHRRSERQRAVLERDPDAIKDALLAEVLTGADPAGTAARLCEFLGMDAEAFAAVTAQPGDADAAEHPAAVRRLVEDRLRDAGSAQHVFCFQRHLVVIFAPGKGPDQSACGAGAADAALWISRLLGGRARIGVSLPHAGAGQIRAACEQADCAMQSSFYGEPGAINFFAPGPPVTLPYPLALQEKLTACLVTGNAQASEAYAREFLSPYRRQRAPLSLLDEHVRMLLRRVEETLTPLLPDTDELRAISESLTPVQRHGWFEGVEAELARAIRGLCTRVETANQNRQSRAVRRAVRFIEENYHRNLPLEEVAKSVSLSPSYFSSSFKREMGKNVVEFITEYRVEKAIELLCSTNLNTSEVAYRVGFNDPKYFARIFKRSVGVRPSQYRKYSREM